MRARVRPKKGPMSTQLMMAGSKVRRTLTKMESMVASLVLIVISLGGTGAITCFCLGHCPGNQLNGTCTAPPGAPCFSGDHNSKIFSPLAHNTYYIHIYICGLDFSKHVIKSTCQHLQLSRRSTTQRQTIFCSFIKLSIAIIILTF